MKDRLQPKYTDMQLLLLPTKGQIHTFPLHQSFVFLGLRPPQPQEDGVGCCKCQQCFDETFVGIFYPIVMILPVLLAGGREHIRRP